MFQTAVETRSERKKKRKKKLESERQRGKACETDTDLYQCLLHNEQCPNPDQLQRTIPHKRDRETKGNGHINYTHSLGGSYYQRVKEGPAERWRDGDRQRSGEDNAHGEPRESLQGGSVCP